MLWALLTLMLPAPPMAAPTLVSPPPAAPAPTPSAPAPTPSVPLGEPLTQPLHDVVTQAIRNCPPPKDGVISVCARDRGFAEKYRIQRLAKPTVDLGDPKIKLSGEGSPLPGECSNIGQAGAIGCSKRDYQDWAAWKRRQQAEAKDRP
jgi:hypothetical protein